jgi:AcrR family transcriptional regulator
MAFVAPKATAPSVQPAIAPEPASSRRGEGAARKGRATKAVFLDAVLAHLIDHGLADVSLRQLAAAAGTSHALLAHHFGSLESLLADVTEEMRRREIAHLTLSTKNLDVESAAQRWRDAANTLNRHTPLFFAISARALNNPERYGQFHRTVMDEPIAHIAEVLSPHDPKDPVALRNARIIQAFWRGLRFDLAATGDIDETAQMITHMLTQLLTPHHRKQDT